MPELPEVESVVRTLRDSSPSLIGLKVHSVDLVWSGVVAAAPGSYGAESLAGYEFKSIVRLGKYMVFGLACTGKQPRYLIVHLRMTGRLFLVQHNQALEKHTRMTVMLNSNLALRFDDPRKFGRVWFVDDPSVVLSGLGPDALTVDNGDFIHRIGQHRRQIKPLLLDQACVAGIGNIYADESLFRAGIHPLSISSELTETEKQRLHYMVKSVLEEAVAANGANIDGVFKAGSFIVSVYGREGAPCRICGTDISKIRVGQRGTHYCRQCQKL